MVADLENAISIDDPRTRKTYYTEMTPFRRGVTPLILGLFGRALAEVQIFGSEKLPAEGAVVLAANHLTNFDVLPLQIAAGSRPIFYMGKEELFRNPLTDWVFRQMGGFPVYRGAGDEWAMQHAERVLRADQVLGIFPEGHRSKGKGLASAKTGAARLALLSGAPIVPVAMHGTQNIARNLPRRTPVHIHIGDPIHARPGESPLSLTNRMMFAMAAMLPPEQRGVYHFKPRGFRFGD